MNMHSSYSLGLIGYPLGHSLSPVLHQTALAEAGLAGEYSLFQIPPLPEGRQELAELLDRLRRGELQGLNVTIPHKQSVLPLVDDLSASANAIGAVNTLYMQEGRLIGHNTDAPGFLTDVNKLPLFESKTALILGAGGAARAVVYALLKQGWQIRITDLNPQQVNDLYEHFSQHVVEISKLEVIEFSPSAIREAADGAHLIINTTPVGMHPNVEACPWPEGMPFPKNACLYDVIYNPAETKLMNLASAAGLPSRNGLGMLVEQAALSFECWTGFHPSRSLMLDGVVKFNPQMARSTP